MERTYDCELYLKDGDKFPEKFIEVAAAQDCYIEIGGDGRVLDSHQTSNLLYGGLILTIGLAVIIGFVVYKIGKLIL